MNDGTPGNEKLGQLFRENSEILVVIGIVSVVGLLVFPLPPALLDLFLALSIAASLMVLLVALYIEKPLQFSSFPALLLLLTLYRLSLNVNSTRLILGSGEAGKVIESFGHFVIGGNMVLQRGREAPIWGWADPGETVAVEFAGQRKSDAIDV